jgi:hypothetical protein
VSLSEIRPEDSACLRDHADRIAAVVAAHAMRMPVEQLDRLLEYRDYLREQAARLEALSDRLWDVRPLSATGSTDTCSAFARAACRKCGTVFAVSDPDPAGHDCPACTEKHCLSCGSRGDCRCWMQR